MVNPSKDMKGEKVADPTRASKPAQPTYRNPLEKGLAVLRPKVGADGAPVSLTGYGQSPGWSGPSSVGVKDSQDLSDLDIAPKGGDPVLASLKSGGFGDRSESGAPIADLQRKIDTTLGPVTYGMRNRSGEGAKVPGKNGGK